MTTTTRDPETRIRAVAADVDPEHLEFLDWAILYSRHYSLGRWWEHELDTIIESSDRSRKAVIATFQQAVQDDSPVDT